MAKRPIEPAEFAQGATITHIGDIRIARGLTRVPHTNCQHRQLVYDQTERRVYCQDCESDVDSFDAFLQLVHQHEQAWRAIRKAHRETQDALKHSLHSRAAKAMDDQWRRHKTVPACPHCHEGLLPEDFTDTRLTTVSREITQQRRKRQTED